MPSAAPAATSAAPAATSAVPARRHASPPGPVPHLFPAPGCSFIPQATASGQLNRATMQHLLAEHAVLLASATRTFPSRALKALPASFRKRSCAAGRHIVAASTTGQCRLCAEERRGNVSGGAPLSAEPGRLRRPRRRTSPSRTLPRSPPPPPPPRRSP